MITIQLKLKIFEDLVIPLILIGISGIDGSGKSTQVTLLNYYLRSKRSKVRYLWLRWFSFFTFFIYLYARLAKRTIIIRLNSKSVHVHLFWIDVFLQNVYPRLLLFDLLLWFYMNKFIARIRKFNFILLDRTYLDTIVDLIWETRSTGFLRCILCRYILKILRNIRLVILVAELGEIFKRKRNEILFPKELTFKKRCFNILAKHLNIPIVDSSNKTVSEIFKKLIKIARLEKITSL